MVALSACDPQRHLVSIVTKWLNAPDQVSVNDVFDFCLETDRSGSLPVPHRGGGALVARYG
jgi:hypothetical protein